MKNSNTLFPFYSTLNEQYINKEYVDKDCFLVSPNNQLLPFILTRQSTTGTIVCEIYNVNTGALEQTLPPSIYIGIYQNGATDYIFYNDTLLASNLDTGYQYYIKLFDGTSTWYSERFAVKKSMTDYLKLEFKNETDLNGVLGFFIQKIYINAVAKTPKYIRTDEATEKDAINIYKSQILQKANVITYVSAPEFVVDSLMTLPLMDIVELSLQNGDTLSIQQVNVTDPEWISENKGATAKFTIELIEYTIIKKLNFTEMGCTTSAASNIRQGTINLTALVEASVVFSSVLDLGYTIDGRAQDAAGNAVRITIPEADLTTSGFKVTAIEDCTFKWTAIKE